MDTKAKADKRTWGGYLLGFSLGGFFDGILLHQILQWPHLLLAVQSGPFRDFRTQVMADGLFHLSIYPLAVVGLCLLYRAWSKGRMSPPRLLLGDALLGFGAWHVLDALLSHWLLGIHRVGMDTANPLIRDALWLLCFGLLPILAGAAVHRSGSASVGKAAAPRSGLFAASVLALSVLVAAPLAALAPKQADAVAMVLQPSHVDSLRSRAPQTKTGMLWVRRDGMVWLLRLNPDQDPDVHFHQGALVVTAPPAALGCQAQARMPAGI